MHGLASTALLYRCHGTAKQLPGANQSWQSHLWSSMCPVDSCQEKSNLNHTNRVMVLTSLLWKSKSSSMLVNCSAKVVSEGVRRTGHLEGNLNDCRWDKPANETFVIETLWILAVFMASQVCPFQVYRLFRLISPCFENSDQNIQSDSKSKGSNKLVCLSRIRHSILNAQRLIGFLYETLKAATSNAVHAKFANSLLDGHSTEFGLYHTIKSRLHLACTVIKTWPSASRGYVSRVSWGANLITLEHGVISSTSSSSFAKVVISISEMTLLAWLKGW